MGGASSKPIGGLFAERRTLNVELGSPRLKSASSVTLGNLFNFC